MITEEPFYDCVAKSNANQRDVSKELPPTINNVVAMVPIKIGAKALQNPSYKAGPNYQEKK
jgi:hypothetical protein